MRRPEPFMEQLREQIHVPPMPPVRHRVTRVKIFATGCASSLEKDINAWLEERGPEFRLEDIKYTKYSAMVIYTDLAPLEDEETK